MSLSSLVNKVRIYLASQHMLVDEEWLSGCVEYLTEDSTNNYSEIDIKNLAKEQWLLNDLKDICPGSLPTNLKSQQKTIITGKFVLQINAALDIGTPAYQQYMKLQKINQENVEATTKFEDKVPNHRMIKLYLTDGIQEVTAIEYKPMRNISCDITPGCKALIKGPIECRRGILLLTEAAIELLGGEVQEIGAANSLACLLSTKLGLPMLEESDTTISHRRNSNIPTPHAQMPSGPDNTDQFVPPETSRPVARVTSLQVATFADDDIDIEQLDALEAQYDNRITESVNSQSNSGANNLNLNTNETKSIVSSKRILPNDYNPKPEKKPKMDTINNPDDYPDDNDLFFEDEDYLQEMEAKFDKKEREIVHKTDVPLKVSAEPFVYIKQIHDMNDSEKAGRVFRIKGQINKLLSKLSVGKDGWMLSCTIVDGTGGIDVDFTSAVLSKLVGLTPHEMAEMKQEMRSKPDVKAKAISTLQKAKDALQTLYCIIEITMLEVPKITCLIPFGDAHVDLLKKRIQNWL